MNPSPTMRSLGLVLLFAWAQPACAAHPGDRPPSPGAIHPTEAEPTYLHLDTIDPDLLAAIRAGIDVARERFGNFGPLRVYVMDGRDDNTALVEDFCTWARPADAGPQTQQLIDYCVEHFELPEEEGRIYSSVHHHSATPFGAIVFLNVHHPADPQDLARETRMLAVHEYVHIFQAAFQPPGGPDPNDPEQQIPGPAWLTEGPATYMAAASVDSSEWVAMAHEQSERAYREAVVRHGVSLADGETYEGPGDPERVHAVLYEGGATAVKWLIDTHSAEAFWEGYYSAVPRLGWEAAFEQTFGMTPESFYVAFADHLEL